MNYKTKTKDELIKELKETQKKIARIEKFESKQKKMEKEWWKSPFMHKILINTLPQKIFVKNRDCMFVSANEKFADDLKLKPEEIENKSLYEFFPKELAAKYIADSTRVMESGKTEEIIEEYVVDGEKRVVQTTKTPIRNENNEVIGLLGIFWDITESRKNEEELKKHRDRLEELVEERTQELERKTQEILDVSTPIMQVWEGVVVAPLIGTLDSQRTQQFMKMLLDRIVETNSPVALVDITGVPVIDTQTAQHLIETINSVKLLGSKAILTGVRPMIAQTLVHLGIDLSDVITRPSLVSGLRVALEMLGKVVTNKNGNNK